MHGKGAQPRVEMLINASPRRNVAGEVRATFWDFLGEEGKLKMGRYHGKQKIKMFFVDKGGGRALRGPGHDAEA